MDLGGVQGVFYDELKGSHITVQSLAYIGKGGLDDVIV
jgi:hypothetical protein